MCSNVMLDEPKKTHTRVVRGHDLLVLLRNVYQGDGFEGYDSSHISSKQCEKETRTFPNPGCMRVE